MLELTINGVNVTQWTEGLDDISVIFSVDRATGAASYTAAGLFKLYERAYLLCKEVYDDYSLLYDAVLTIPGIGQVSYTINAKNVTLCDCYAEVSLQSITDDERKYNLIRKKIISDDNAIYDLYATGGVDKVGYCNEPNFIGYVLLILYMILKVIVDVVIIIISIFDSDINIDSFGNIVLGCGRYHYVWNVHKTIRYWLDKVGLGFQSSILTTRFKDLYFLDAYGEEGNWRHKSSQGLDDTNYIVNLTIPQFCERLKPIFNADYRVIDGVFVFERVDWFPANASKIDGNLAGLCYEHDKERLVGSYKFEWSSDFMDETSQIVASKYGGRINMNPGDNDTLVGSRNVISEFALTRYTYDEHGDDFIRRHRLGPFVGGSLLYDIVLSNGQTTSIRLMMLPNKYGQYRAPVTAPLPGGGIVMQPELSFKGQKGNSVTTVGHLWEHYHSIEDPEQRRYKVQSVDFVPSDPCRFVELMLTKGMNVYVPTDFGRLVPQTVEYKIKERIFTLQNCTIWP